MKIGIFGGSFNPPHNMHKNIALDLIKNKYLDKVIYVPTGNKYNKKELANQNDRYNMLKLMIEGYDNLDVSNYEFCKLTFTYETLNHFKNIYKNDEIYFICGSDNLKEITTWKNYDYILDNFKLIVIRRNNDDINKILSKINSKNIVVPNINSDNISSSYIRKNINNEKILKIMDENIVKYIIENNLYR